MQKTKKVLSGVMAFATAAAMVVPAFAQDTVARATSTDPITADPQWIINSSTIDFAKKGSIDLYKIDFTNAERDGVWDNSYVSTGVHDQTVEDKLINNAVRKGDTDGVSDLGNGQTSNGYAIKGVEFTYAKIADICTYSWVEDGTNRVEVLYGIDKTTGAGFLEAIGLTGGADAYNDKIPGNGPMDPQYQTHFDKAKNYYYDSTRLMTAMKESLKADPVAVKDALEKYIATAPGMKAMPLTDENGYTQARDLELGLYLMVETKVPEMVTNTTNPFLVSLPMTTTEGTNVNAPQGGADWMYDVVLYPKNETAVPNIMEKTVRENVNDGGRHDGTEKVDDGFAHTATASSGDKLDYQIISQIPAITSNATELSNVAFEDVLQGGISYFKNDPITIEFFKDRDCTQSTGIKWTWTEGAPDANFTVAFTPAERPDENTGAVTMRIEMTAAGLEVINNSDAIYGSDDHATQVRRGLSDMYIRIRYSAKLDADKSAVMGDSGNANKVTMTWKRTSEAYFDQLIDDCHVFTFGIDLNKTFKDSPADAAEKMKSVNFVLWNETDGHWVHAALNEGEGIYYVDGHTNSQGEAGKFDNATGHNGEAGNKGLDAEAAAATGKATVFTPVANGNVYIHGLENDKYVLTEVRTAQGYTLLKNDIVIDLVAEDDADHPCAIYEQDKLGVTQNDPRYATELNDGKLDAGLMLGNGMTGLAQKALAHNMLTGSATVDGNAVTMGQDGDSVNAVAPLVVVNDRGFDLPQTGEVGAMLMPLTGVAALAIIGGVMFVVKKREEA